MARKLGRRLVLISGGALVAGAAVAGGAGVAACSAVRRRQEVAALPGLFAATDDMFDPVGLGRAHLARRDLPALLDQLEAEPALAGIGRIDCPHARRARLRARFRDEMRAGATTLAGGWVVARSEALLAALWVAHGGRA
jgi:hypothetical protein